MSPASCIVLNIRGMAGARASDRFCRLEVAVMVTEDYGVWRTVRLTVLYHIFHLFFVLLAILHSIKTLACTVIDKAGILL